MFKKKTIKIISPIALLLILAVTNPTYSQHERKIADICNASQKSGDIAVCPLGYGSKKILAFERESFSVYNALILSYSIYDNELASVGFLGNVFSSMDS